MAFIGRTSELALLEEAHAARGSVLLPVYGRRRVGKSELLVRFLKDHRGVYFVGKTAPAGLQLRELLGEAARVLDEPLLASLPAEDWKQRLIDIESRFQGTGKLVLVLDEFQWIVGASPELPSVLQELWDRRWKASGRVMLVLCGSYVGFMEREVLGAKSPLFGRRTGQIQLRPFGYREAAAFHPSWSIAQKAAAYFVCGGIPEYLKAFSESRSVEQNIEACLLEEFAPLFREPDFLLREELRDVAGYYGLLLAIAAGYHGTAAIAAHAGLPERNLHYYLQQLIELGYVGRHHPLAGKKVTRNVRYILEDPLLRFWFRFVFPNLSFIQSAGAKEAYRVKVRPELSAYFGGCFERLCREALPHVYRREHLNATFEIGEYWDKSTQIDVVGMRDDGRTDLGECKWGHPASAARLAAELESKIARYPNSRGATIARRVFVRTRPKATPAMTPPIVWHDLDDLYR